MVNDPSQSVYTLYDYIIQSHWIHSNISLDSFLEWGAHVYGTFSLAPHPRQIPNLVGMVMQGSGSLKQDMSLDCELQSFFSLRHQVNWAFSNFLLPAALAVDQRLMGRAYCAVGCSGGGGISNDKFDNVL